MSKLQPFQIDDQTVIYLEASDDIKSPTIVVEPQETTRTAKGIPSFNAREQITQNFQAIETTIRIYTQYTLNAFRASSLPEVKTVKLEFGVNVSGEGGIPYIASGTVGCNIKVTVECEFSDTRSL